MMIPERFGGTEAARFATKDSSPSFFWCGYFNDGKASQRRGHALTQLDTGRNYEMASEEQK
jgi:hypothetical protein